MELSGILCLVLIDGYEGEPLVPGEPLLEMPGFWAAYFWWVGMFLTEEEAATGQHPPAPAEWFGVSEAEFNEAHALLSAGEEWPVFRIPLTGGHAVTVVHWNGEPEPEAGADYLIQHPDWGRSAVLARAGPNFDGPGLAWRELVHIARNPDPSAAEGIRNPHQRLLMLLPITADEDRPDDGADLVVDALVSTGLPAGQASRVADRVFSQPLWNPARWTFPERRPDANGEVFAGILQCDFDWGPRAGVRLARGITREQSDQLARALGTWPESGIGS